MVKHGFTKKLNQDYALILKAWPYDKMMRQRLALEIKKYGGKSLIEFGCGSGEATSQIIKYNPKLHVLATDIDQAVIDNAQRLRRKNVTFKPVDALKFHSAKKYDIVTSSHFLHNFVHKKQLKLLKMHYDILNHGGLFIMVEKIFPDNPALQKEYWDRLMRRFKVYDKYGRPDVKKAMIAHETIDKSADSIIIESPFKKTLAEVGFRDITVVLRKDNDIVISARKPANKNPKEPKNRK